MKKEEQEEIVNAIGLKMEYNGRAGAAKTRATAISLLPMALIDLYMRNRGIPKFDERMKNVIHLLHNIAEAGEPEPRSLLATRNAVLYVLEELSTIQVEPLEMHPYAKIEEHLAALVGPLDHNAIPKLS